MNKDAIIKVAKGAGIAAAGAGLTYFGQHVMDLGIPAEYLPALTAIFSILVNAARKWLTTVG